VLTHREKVLGDMKVKLPSVLTSFDTI